MDVFQIRCSRLRGAGGLARGKRNSGASFRSRSVSSLSIMSVKVRVSASRVDRDSRSRRADDHGDGTPLESEWHPEARGECVRLTVSVEDVPRQRALEGGEPEAASEAGTPAA